jgi:hypothetical protein
MTAQIKSRVVLSPALQDRSLKSISKYEVVKIEMQIKTNPNANNRFPAMTLKKLLRGGNVKVRMETISEKRRKRTVNLARPKNRE